MVATATATAGKSSVTRDYNRVTLSVGVSKDDADFTVTLLRNGTVKVECPEWSNVYPIDTANGWITDNTAKKKPLANLAPLPGTGNIDAIDILDWRAFMTALKVFPSARE